MPTLTHAETLIIGTVVGPVLFVASVFLTGARGRRILGGVAGAIVYGLATFVWDRMAAAAGWWHYPFDPSASSQVLVLDLIAGVVAGGALDLSAGASRDASAGEGLRASWLLGLSGALSTILVDPALCL